MRLWEIVKKYKVFVLSTQYCLSCMVPDLLFLDFIFLITVQRSIIQNKLASLEATLDQN